MNAREFCYWLQGAFELCGMAEIDGARAAQIKAHLALVAKCDPNHRNTFVTWLDLTMNDGGYYAKGMTARDVEMVGKLLAAQFQHEIDPSYGGDSAALQAAHDGGQVPSGPKFRC